jgi:hypothetical protein
MPGLDTLEKPVPPVEAPTQVGRRASRRDKLMRLLLTPLLGVSVVLHVALLFIPFPARDLAEVSEGETVPEEQEGAVDLLSLTNLAVEPPPEAPEPPPQEPPPQQQSAPPPPGSVPPPPDPTQIPEGLPEPTEDNTPQDEGLPNDDLPPSNTPPASAFDPARQQVLLGLGSAIGRPPGESNFDVTEILFPAAAWQQAFKVWAPDRLQCFFTSIAQETYQLAPGAADVKYLSRNIQFIEREDLPRTFSGLDVVKFPDGYCGNDFYEVQEAGVQVGIWVSVIGVGAGNPPGTAVIIFWIADPRS